MRDVSAPTLSVIVPCRNVGSAEVALARLVPLWTHGTNDCEAPDITCELICVVDDLAGSTLPLAPTNGEQSVHVRVVGNIKPTGPGGARNTGLSNAHGQYVYFMDDDDRVAPGVVLRTLNAMVHSQSDVGLFDYVVTVGAHATFHGTSATNPRPRSTSLLLDSAGIWRLVLRREFAIRHDLSFPHLRYGEDLLFIVELLSRKPIIHHQNEIGYAYSYSSPDFRNSAISGDALTVLARVGDHASRPGTSRDLRIALATWTMRIARLLILRSAVRQHRVKATTSLVFRVGRSPLVVLDALLGYLALQRSRYRNTVPPSPALDDMLEAFG